MNQTSRPRGLRHTLRAFAATAVVAGVVTAGPSMADAGSVSPTSDIGFRLIVEGVGAEPVLDALTLELFTVGDGIDVLPTPAATCTTSDNTIYLDAAERFTDCVVPDGDYSIGVDGIPDEYSVDVNCSGVAFPAEALLVEDSLFSLSSADANCQIYVRPPANLSTIVYSPSFDYKAVLADIEVEAFTEPGGENAASPANCVEETRSSASFESNPFGGYKVVECELPPGPYTLGMTGQADDVTVDFASCLSDSDDLVPTERLSGRGDATFTVVADQMVTCNVFLLSDPALLVDLTIDGGPATGDDFGIEVYDTSGVLTATLQDPDASAGCGSGDNPDYTGDGGIVGIVGFNRAPELPSFGLESCGIARFPAGDYELAATLPDYGYVVDDIECFPVASFRFLGDQSSTGGTVDERLERDVGQIMHGSGEGGEGTTETVCLVNVRYLEQTFSADVVVVDGDLDPTSVIIEVYDQDGTLVDSTVDPEPGVGNASAQFTLPLGDYTFGVSGIGEYRVAVEVSPVAVPTELIDDPNANFSLVQGATVSGLIMLTTIAPTVPTLTVDPNVVLPATGPSSTTTPTMLLIALGFLVFGGFAVAGTRRR